MPSDCLPNINDLRQIFDDGSTQSNVGLRHSTGGEPSSKRSSHTERTLLQQQQASSFFDAKTSHVEENIFESKSRNLEFERAKQKFDNPTHLHHQHRHHQREQRERSSGRYGPNNSGGSGSGSGSGSNGNSNQLNAPNNRANLALPLKSTTAMAVGHNNGSNSNSNLNSNSSNLSKDDINRQLFEDHSRSSTVGGSGVGATSADAKFYQKDHTNTSTGGSYSRNSINLDGLKVSDDEVSNMRICTEDK